MNSTLQNGFRVLEYLSITAKAYAVSDLAREMDLPKSHVHRLLRSLCELGYVVQNEQRRYALGIGALRLVSSLLHALPLRKAAFPFLHELALETRGISLLAQPYQRDAIIVALLSADGKLRDPVNSIGRVLTVKESATGKLFFSLRDEMARARIIESMREEGVDESYIERLENSVDEVRETGVSIKDNAYSYEMTSLAVPLYDVHGNILGALGLTHDREQLQDDTLTTSVRLMKEKAQLVEEVYREATAEKRLQLPSQIISPAIVS